MRTLGNILWHFPFLGFITAALTFLWGLILTVTVIGAPIGKGLIEYSKFLLAPYSRNMINETELNIKHSEAWNKYSTIIKITYIPFGVLHALLIIIQLVLLSITIIGIPIAIVLAKSISTIVNPVGKVCVSSGVADEIDKRKSKNELDATLNNNKEIVEKKIE